MTWFKFSAKTNGATVATYRWLEKDELLDEVQFAAEVNYQARTWAEATFAAADRFTYTHEEVDSVPDKERGEMILECMSTIRRQSLLLDKLGQDAIRHEDNSLNALNGYVTGAILHAEELDLQAARGWERVAALEAALAAANPPGLERKIAQEGADGAKAKAKARRGHR